MTTVACPKCKAGHSENLDDPWYDDNPDGNATCDTCGHVFPILWDDIDHPYTEPYVKPLTDMEELADRFIQKMTFPCPECDSVVVSVVGLDDPPTAIGNGDWRFVIRLLCGDCDSKFSVSVDTTPPDPDVECEGME